MPLPHDPFVEYLKVRAQSQTPDVQEIIDQCIRKIQTLRQHEQDIQLILARGMGYPVRDGKMAVFDLPALALAGEAVEKMKKKRQPGGEE